MYVDDVPIIVARQRLPHVDADHYPHAVAHGDHHARAGGCISDVILNNSFEDDYSGLRRRSGAGGQRRRKTYRLAFRRMGIDPPWAPTCKPRSPSSIRQPMQISPGDVGKPDLVALDRSEEAPIRSGSSS